MTNKSNKERTVLIISAVLLCIIVIVFSILLNKKTLKSDVVFFGDSTMVGSTMLSPISDKVAASTGLTCLNGAFGGMTMARNRTVYYSDRVPNFTMIGIAEMINAGNLKILPNAARTDDESMYDHIVDHSEDLAGLDLGSVRYIVIGYGINDCLIGIPAVNESDPYDTDSFAGALRSSIELIRKAMPKAKIILVTPSHIMPEAFNSSRVTDEAVEGYVDAEVLVAREYGLDVIDCYHDLGITKENCGDYLADGLHYNEEGGILVAEKISEAISGLQ